MKINSVSANLLFLSIIVLFSCSRSKQIDIPTARVVKGVFSEELTEEGSIMAVNSMMITAPRISYRYGMLKIASLIEDGSEVNHGDTVLVFDPTEINKAIINAEQQIEIAKAEYEKLKATQESEIEDLDADLRITTISHEISGINYENARFESEIKKKEIKLQMETATISLERAKEQIANKKRIHKEELYQKELNISQLNANLQEAREALSSLFVVSPSRGIVIIKDNYMSGQKWQAGDQPYPGFPIIDLPDLSKMMVEVKINEVDISKVQPGQEVILQSDAYADTTYAGKVTEVANLAQPKAYKSKIKVFPTRILIDGINQKWLPGLTVSCRILVNKIDDVLYLPLEAIFEEMGSRFVYLKTKSGFERREIITAEENTDFVWVS